MQVVVFLHRAMRARCAPRWGSVRDAAASSWLPLRVLLVFRVLAAALLVAHTVLFSASGHFYYGDAAVLSNVLLLVALLMAMSCSLCHLVNDQPAAVVGPPPTESPALSAFSDDDSCVVQPVYEGRVLRAMAAGCLPVMQVAGSVVFVSAAVAWLTRRGIPTLADTPTKYAAMALHAANPAIYLLDLLLAAQQRRRLRLSVTPIVYIGIAFYIILARFVLHRSDMLPTSKRDIIISSILAIAIPPLLVLLAWIPSICHIRKSIPKKEHNPPTPVSSDAHSSTASSTAIPDTLADRAPRSPPRVRSPPGSPADRERMPRPTSALLAARLSGASQGSGSGIRASRSASSLGSEARLRRLVRVASAGSDSSAWSGVADVTVDMDTEHFRMPGDNIAVPLPPRFASVSSTSLA